MNEKTFTSNAKYDALVGYLRMIGVGKGSTERAVIFAERVPTLEWLRAKLQKEFGFTPAEVEVLHGGLTDVDQQGIVESFKQAALSHPDPRHRRRRLRRRQPAPPVSPAHPLRHPMEPDPHRATQWTHRSLRPATPTADHHPAAFPSSDTFGGDLRVLSKLIEKEQEAHKALGDAASLMGKYSVEAEEEAIRKVLAREAAFDDVVGDADDPGSLDQLAALMALIQSAPAPVRDLDRHRPGPAGGGALPPRDRLPP